MNVGDVFLLVPEFGRQILLDFQIIRFGLVLFGSLRLLMVARFRFDGDGLRHDEEIVRSEESGPCRSVERTFQGVLVHVEHGSIDVVLKEDGASRCLQGTLHRVLFHHGK